MPETYGSSPEDGDQSAAKLPQRPENIRQIEHDARGQLGVIAMGLDIVDMQLPQEDPARGPVQAAKRSVETIATMLREAVNREPFPEHPLSDVQDMLKTVLCDLCAREHRCVVIVDGEQECSDVSPDAVRITLGALPEDIRRYNIPASHNGFERILDNLIRNAIRKGAKNIRVSVTKSAAHEVALSVSDDGEGMKLKILKSLRAGVSDTDKSGTEVAEGRTVEDHGHGVQAVRQIITERCGGSMEIFSVKKSDVEDSDGDGQDSDSLKNHPFASGATFRFRLPVSSMKLNGDHPPVEEQCPPSVRLLTRRRMIGLTAAAFVGAAYFAIDNERLNESDDAERPVSPLSDLTFDEFHSLKSFSLQVNGERISYETGTPLPSFLRDVRTVPLDNGSLTVIDPAVIDGMKLRRMFLCTFENGVFGQVDTAFRGNRQMGFICADAASKNLSAAPVYLLTDTVFSTRADSANIAAQTEAPPTKSSFSATSLSLLRAPQFNLMAADLQRAASLLLKQTQYTNGASLNAVRPILLKLLKTQHALRTNAVSAHDMNELLTLIEETDKFIVPDELVINQLRQTPLLVRTSTIRNTGGSACLQDISPAEAQAMIRVI